MTEKSYWELLRDPRWQRKRLEVMQLADFKCQICEADDKTLNVHHKLYRKGAKPWEYELHELQCLCEECHKAHHGLDQILKSALARLQIDDLEQVLGYARGLVARREIEPSDEVEPEPPNTSVYEIPSDSYAAGFFAALWIDYTRLTLDKHVSKGEYGAAELWEMHLDNSLSTIKRLRDEREAG